MDLCTECLVKHNDTFWQKLHLSKGPVESRFGKFPRRHRWFYTQHAQLPGLACKGLLTSRDSAFPHLDLHSAVCPGSRLSRGESERKWKRRTASGRSHLYLPSWKTTALVSIKHNLLQGFVARAAWQKANRLWNYHWFTEGRHGRGAASYCCWVPMALLMGEL